MNEVLEHVEQVMRALDEHKTNLAFLECELSQKQFQSAGEADHAEVDVRMEVDQEMLNSASRQMNSALSRVGSKSSEVSHLQGQFEGEIADLRQ